MKLKSGDKVAAVSLSWGGPGAFPERYKQGKAELENRFGLELVAMPNALREPQWLENNPQARAEDLHQAFADPDIKAVFSTIGGDDSIRLLPFLDEGLIRANPKPFMGYSDTTVTHLYLNSLGINSYFGPAIMAGFAENGGMFSYTERAVRRFLFDDDAAGEWLPCDQPWCNEPPDFTLDYSDKRAQHPPLKRKVLQGEHRCQGHLLGGCVEALDFCIGTSIWPSLAHWDGAILFIEIANAELMTPLNRFVWFLRNLAVTGVLNKVNGILFARPGQTLSPDKYHDYETALLKVLKEAGCERIPVFSRMEFGHTDPMFVIPYGATAELDPLNEKVFVQAPQ